MYIILCNYKDIHMYLYDFFKKKFKKILCEVIQKKQTSNVKNELSQRYAILGCTITETSESEY